MNVEALMSRLEAVPYYEETHIAFCTKTGACFLAPLEEVFMDTTMGPFLKTGDLWQPLKRSLWQSLGKRPTTPLS